MFGAGGFGPSIDGAHSEPKSSLVFTQRRFRGCVVPGVLGRETLVCIEKLHSLPLKFRSERSSLFPCRPSAETSSCPLLRCPSNPGSSGVFLRSTRNPRRLTHQLVSDRSAVRILRDGADLRGQPGSEWNPRLKDSEELMERTTSGIDT
jgi:hypothetical protein